MIAKKCVEDEGRWQLHRDLLELKAARTRQTLW
jgi:hypothetical protein